MGAHRGAYTTHTTLPQSQAQAATNTPTANKPSQRCWHEYFKLPGYQHNHDTNPRLITTTANNHVGAACSHGGAGMMPDFRLAGSGASPVAGKQYRCISYMPTLQGMYTAQYSHCNHSAHLQRLAQCRPVGTAQGCSAESKGTYSTMGLLPSQTPPMLLQQPHRSSPSSQSVQACGILGHTSHPWPYSLSPASQQKLQTNRCYNA